MTRHDGIARVGKGCKRLMTLFLPIAPIAAVIISVISLTITIVLDAESRACSFMHMNYDRLSVLAETVYSSRIEAGKAFFVLEGDFKPDDHEWKNVREDVDEFFVTLMAHVESTRGKLQLHRVSISESVFVELDKLADDAHAAYNDWRGAYREKTDMLDIANFTLVKISDYMNTLDDKT